MSQLLLSPIPASTTAAPRALRAMADSLKLITLRGAGLEARVSPLGATLTSLLVPDRNGQLAGACRRARAAGVVTVANGGMHARARWRRHALTGRGAGCGCGAQT
jgi:hypothetical protein